MPRPANDVASGLCKKGFESRENDHTFFHLYVDGRKSIIFTKISHGEKEIGDRLLAMMARQLRLSRKQFLDLIDCPLAKTQYVSLLRNAGVLANSDQSTKK